MAAIPAATNAYDIREKSTDIITLTAGEELKQGWIVGINPTTGKAVKAGAAGVITLGRVETYANKDDELSIRRSGFWLPADNALTLDDKLVGKIAYAQNQNSVTTTSSANARPAGIVLAVKDGHLLVDTSVAPIIPTPTV